MIIIKICQDLTKYSNSYNTSTIPVEVMHIYLNIHLTHIHLIRQMPLFFVYLNARS